MVIFTLQELRIILRQLTYLGFITTKSGCHLVHLLAEVTGILSHLHHLLCEFGMCLDICLLLLLAHLLEALHLGTIGTLGTQNLDHHFVLYGLLLRFRGILVVQDIHFLLRQSEHVLNLILPLLSQGFHLSIRALLFVFLQLFCTGYHSCNLLGIGITLFHGAASHLLCRRQCW